MTTTDQCEYVMRVKLPSSGAFAACPSGDTDYENAYRNAIMEHLPVDRDGLTWVKLYCTDPNKALENARQRVAQLQKQIEHIKKLGGDIIRFADS